MRSVTSVLDTSYEAAFWGLPALIDDGTNRDNYFGILRSDAPSLKSYVVARLVRSRSTLHSARPMW
jgi:hypothetical protein